MHFIIMVVEWKYYITVQYIEICFNTLHNTFKDQHHFVKYATPSIPVKLISTKRKKNKMPKIEAIFTKLGETWQHPTEDRTCKVGYSRFQTNIATTSVSSFLLCFNVKFLTRFPLRSMKKSLRILKKEIFCYPEIKERLSLQSCINQWKQS